VTAGLRLDEEKGLALDWYKSLVMEGFFYRQKLLHTHTHTHTHTNAHRTVYGTAIGYRERMINVITS